ncbi:HAMP domain-containing sensor histidine kinase [Clostridium sp. 1001275B_160808_H3]|uniref:sensor histidine kinase n=1 Tax=Clostridium sp. 1001275B_160808_H3 TaxID=2787110 RepID=UPI001898FAD6|nr:HAMP domain-containing sensor histidine kinase [Clostridium sp. 1001275B_160808_H3]
MNKISKRIVKYMILMNLVVTIIGLILTSFILPKIYINNEYIDLEEASEYVLEAAKNNTVTDLANIYAVLINNGKVTNMCKAGKGHGHMGQMGMMGQMNSIDYESIKGRQIFKSSDGNTYIGLKRNSGYGDIVVYKSYEGTKSLIKSVNLIMISIFIFSLIISAFIAIYLGEKFTKPIISLRKRANDISKGIYGSKFEVNTKDEIQELNDSIDNMAKELEVKDNMQKEFIANVSHDLKTPLSVIRANSEVIKDELVSGKEVVEYASSIIKEVDILTDLVGEILVLTKLRDNKKVIKPLEYEIKNFVKESYDKLNNYLIKGNYDNYSLHLKIDKNLDGKKIFASIDNNYLFRVISNFFINAIKHSEGKNKNIVFGLKEVDKNIEIYIKDYGKGIEQESIKYIWDRYYKGNESGGMGLGLAISKEIILAHEFNYRVESNIGEGSKFSFIIPRNLIKEK